MDFQTKVKSGAKIELRIGLTSDGVRHIRIVADSIESRDWAMLQVMTLRPAFELMESLLSPPTLEAPDVHASSK